MEIKVGQVSQSAPVEQTQAARPVDGSFKFMLASHIEEAELQTRLQGLMEEITRQGDQLSKRRDVKDMKRYRGLIKEFLNEVVTHSHSFFPGEFFGQERAAQGVWHYPAHRRKSGSAGPGIDEGRKGSPGHLK